MDAYTIVTCTHVLQTVCAIIVAKINSSNANGTNFRYTRKYVLLVVLAAVPRFVVQSNDDITSSLRGNKEEGSHGAPTVQYTHACEMFNKI